MHSVRGQFDTRAIFRRAKASPGSRDRSFGPVNQIQNGTLNRRIADFLQMKEPAPIPTLATELQPVLIAGDLRLADREDTLLVCHGLGGVAAVVGQQGTHEVRNPPGSGVLCKMRDVFVSVDGTLALYDFIMGITPNQITALAGFSAVVNSRAPTPSTAVKTGSIVQIPPTPGSTLIGNWFIQNFTPGLLFDLEGVVLPPGFSLIVACQTLNAASRVTWRWTEESLVR